MILPSAMTNQELYQAILAFSSKLECINMDPEHDDNRDDCSYELCPVRQLEELADEVMTRLGAGEQP